MGSKKARKKSSAAKKKQRTKQRTWEIRHKVKEACYLDAAELSQRQSDNICVQLAYLSNSTLT